MAEQELQPTPHEMNARGPGQVRSLIVVALLILGSIASVVASVGVWAERSVYDEDGFVSSVDAVFDEEPVQAAIAHRLGDATYELIGVEDLVTGVLVGLDDLLADAGAAVGERTENVEAESTRDRPSLTLLAVPLSNAVRELFFKASLSVIRSQPFKEIRDSALRVVHRQVTAIIEESDDAGVRREGDQVILDLGSVIERVIIAVAGEQGEQFLERLEIPDDAGEFVVRDEGDYAWIWTLARAARDSVVILVAIAAGLFALAVVVSPNRRGTIIVAGLTAALSATALVIALPASREIAVNWLLDPESDAAARAFFNVVIVRQLQLQSLIVIAGGVAVAAGAAFTGESELAVALRRSVRPRRDRGDAASVTEALRRRAGALRLWGLGITGALLLAWPDPANRVSLTILALLVVYLLIITLATSDAEWAAGTRARIGGFWDRYLGVRAAPEAMADGPVRGWIAVRAGWFRGLGILAAGAALLFWPSLSFGAAIGVIAATLVYLAVLEAITNR